MKDDTVRPDINISWERHDAVTDFADEHDMSMSEAYDHLLERGLKSESTSV